MWFSYYNEGLDGLVRRGKCLVRVSEAMWPVDFLNIFLGMKSICSSFSHNNVEIVGFSIPDIVL